MLALLQDLYEEGPFDQNNYPFWPAAWAYAYSGMGYEEEALRWLNELAALRDARRSAYWSAHLAANALAFPLLDEPTFVEVRERLGFD